MNLRTIADLFDTPCLSDIPLTGVSIDSRKLRLGNLFVALRGENFDGHDFIKSAVAHGAVAVICSRFDSEIDVPQIIVEDTLRALVKLANYHRQTIDCPVIALTGSNGKTTVKEMIAAILPQPSHATPGNLNNHIGVPLTVLQLQPEHRYAVLELGANHPGEIAHTVAIAKPQVALINNIAPAHIEGFGSIDGVAHAKGEIYQGLPDQGVAIVNADDHYAHFWDDILINKKVLRFSLNKSVDVFARNLSFDVHGYPHFELVLPTGQAPVVLKVPGEHAVRNALAAASCSYAVGISLDRIVEGLQQFRGVTGRMMFLPGKNDSMIIDDTYNANLGSVLTALEVLATRKGRRILVLGDLSELGPWTQPHHEEIGEAARRQGIDRLLTCGTHSEYSSKVFGAGGNHYKNQEELAQYLLSNLDKETTVLIKGSRSAAMEQIVQKLLN